MEIQEKAKKQHNDDARRTRYAAWGAAAAALVLCAAGLYGVLGGGTAPAGGNAPQTVAAAPAATAKAETRADAAAHDASGYDELYALIDEMTNRGNDVATSVTADGGVMTEAAAAEPAMEAAMDTSAPAPAAKMDAGGAENGYSGTNVQVQGVDEADVVKTDGNYIYYVANSQLTILRPDGADSAVVGSVMLENDDSWWGYTTEMYLAGDRLMLLSQGSATVWEGGMQDNARSEDGMRILLYDVSDPANPKKLATLGQSGSYVSSRMDGDYVYIVTSQYVWQPVRNQPRTFVPTLSVDGAAETLPAADISVYGAPDRAAYTVIGAIDIAHGLRHASAKAVFGASDAVYCANGYLLLACGEYESETTPIAPDENGRNVQITVSEPRTRLMLFSLDHEKIARLASAYVPGSLLNQYAMDLYKDSFRIVASVSRWEQRVYTDGVDTYEYEDENWNALYTLDLSLSMLAKIDKLAEDEFVRSVRFDGDIGYFVTFRQTDPLFAVDLSDPKAPRVLDALKIPGFSAYLHVFGDGRLLGIGYAADEKTGATQGVKLSMFDVSDKTNVRELTTAKVDAGWTNAESNHKCVFVDTARGLIGFPAEDAYYLYGYGDEQGFTLLKKVSALDDVYSWNLRGVRVGDYLYVCAESGAAVLSLASYEKIAFVRFPVG